MGRGRSSGTIAARGGQLDCFADHKRKWRRPDQITEYGHTYIHPPIHDRDTLYPFPRCSIRLSKESRGACARTAMAARAGAKLIIPMQCSGVTSVLRAPTTSGQPI